MHEASTPHIDLDTLVMHALDALPRDQVVAVGRHLAVCAHCRGELASLRETAALLPYSLPTADVPPELRDRVLANVQASDASPARETQEPTRTTRIGATRRWFPRLAPVLAAALLVVGFLLGRAWPSAGTTDLASRPNARRVALAGRGSGTFVVVPRDGQVRLSVTGLPSPGDNRVYQLWLMGGSAPISVGTFTVDANGRGELEISGLAWAGTYSAVGITAEPLGGSATPTGAIVAQGHL
jgi:anti-sigma-K factor RskA